MRRRGRHVLAVVATLAFLAGGGISPLAAGGCPQHAAGASSVDLPPASHADHDGHDGHDGSPDAPPDDGHGHDCRCLGECCPGVSPARDAAVGSTPLEAGRAAADAVTAALDLPMPSGPWLLPFANGPPRPA